jgi:hypothetical protein
MRNKLDGIIEFLDDAGGSWSLDELIVDTAHKTNLLVDEDGASVALDEYIIEFDEYGRGITLDEFLESYTHLMLENFKNVIISFQKGDE